MDAKGSAGQLKQSRPPEGIHAAAFQVVMHHLRPLGGLGSRGFFQLTCLLGAGETVASEAVLALALEGAKTIEAARIGVTW